eukprot:113764-Prorocentrum_minimum.AAC.3
MISDSHPKKLSSTLGLYGTTSRSTIRIFIGRVRRFPPRWREAGQSRADLGCRAILEIEKP